MFRKVLSLILAMGLLLSASALGERQAETVAGETFYPDRENWTYRYDYEMPQLVCEEGDTAAMAVNAALQTVLDEMLYLILPMLSRTETVTSEGRTEIVQRYRVTCNTERVFSLITFRDEKRGEETWRSVETETFDVGGEYAGETLTLRGLVRVGDSSDQLSEALMPVMYEEFTSLQQRGIGDPDITEEDFYEICEPAIDFYADEAENAVFYFQPELMADPMTDLQICVFTPEELAELAAAYAAYPVPDEE